MDINVGYSLQVNLPNLMYCTVTSKASFIITNCRRASIEAGHFKRISVRVRTIREGEEEEEEVRIP